MVFGAAKIMNFAQGELFMVGGYVAYFFTTVHLGFVPTLVLTAAVLAFIGVMLSATLFRRVTRSARSLEIGIVMTLGLSIVLQESALSVYGIQQRRPTDPVKGRFWDIGGVTIQGIRLIAVLVAIVVLALLAVVLHRTRIGLAIRGVPANRDLARTLGIPERRIQMFALAIGCALSGVAAAAIAPFYGVYPSMGAGFIYIGFAILFMGGLTSIAGTALAALLVGIAVSVMGGIFSAAAASVAPLVVMAVVVLLRPQGLLGRRARAA
jgi:branched-subunit amino acid ABC-type transport system permease component